MRKSEWTKKLINLWIKGSANYQKLWKNGGLEKGKSLPSLDWEFSDTENIKENDMINRSIIDGKKWN